MGEVLPVWDDAEKKTIEIPFRFPVGDVLDNFRIALTAADEALTEERDPQQVLMRKNALMQDGEWVMKALMSLLNLEQPLPQTAATIVTKMIERVQMQMRQLMGQQVTNEEDYDLTAQLEAFIQERNMALMQQQLMQQQQAMMPTGVPSAQSQTGGQPTGPVGPPGGPSGTNQSPESSGGVPVPPPQAPAESVVAGAGPVQ